jgi:tetrahydrodipicolinate N-succinyltransferase
MQTQYHKLKQVTSKGKGKEENKEDKEEIEWVRTAVTILDSITDQSWLSWAGEELMPHLVQITHKEENARMQEEVVEAGWKVEAVKEVEVEAARVAQT